VKRSVFYFDDDKTLLENFDEMFCDEYDVRTAATLVEARHVLQEFRPEIIVSDQMMPEIEGTAFLGEAMSLCPDSFRILLTGWMVAGEVMPELGAGIIHLFLPKPWREEQMRAVLERAALHYDLRRAR
jgi:DNA-binding NtrC family response regulator